MPERPAYTPSSLLLALFALIAVPLLHGCVIVTDVDASWPGLWGVDETPIEDVDTVVFEARGTLYITQGHGNELRTQGDDAALRELNIEQRGDTLIISQGADWRWFEIGGSDPTYHLEIDDLERIRHRGHGTLKVGPLNLDDLSVESSGNAKTYLSTVNVPNAAFEAHGHANIRVETLDARSVDVRAREHADVFIQDASVLDAYLAAAAHAEIWISGEADTTEIKAGDHANIVADSFSSAMASVHSSDHANVHLDVSQTLTLNQNDHSEVVAVGDAEVVERDGG